MFMILNRKDHPKRNKSLSFSVVQDNYSRILDRKFESKIELHVDYDKFEEFS